MNEEIRGFYLKNNGGFVARIRCNGIVYDDICKGHGQTLDLATVVGIKDGDVVYFEVVVVAGKNKTIGERFIYRKASEKRACYTISGTTLNNKLTYNGTEKYFDKTMYAYINNYPKDRENGWSHEANGVCHDDKNWFFTQDGNLWKFPITHDLNSTCNKADSNGILRHVTGYHLGEIEYYNEYLFVAVSKKLKDKKNIDEDYIIDENNISKEVLKTPEDIDNELSKIKAVGDNGKIFIFKAKDLSFVRSVIIKQKNGSLFNSDYGYLAINKNGLLYTSIDDLTKPYSFLHVYSIGSIFDKEMLTLHSTLALFDENSEPLVLQCMQGGCFDDDNYLHLLTGFVTNYDGRDAFKTDLNNNLDRIGISVFKVSENPIKGKTNTAIRIAHSGQSGDFAFQFDRWGDEPEGITYWDIDKARIELSNKLNIEQNKIAPNIEGQLHAIMLNNAGNGIDDFYLKHYRRISNNQPQYTKPIKIENIRYIALKNDGWFVARIKVNGVFGSYNVDKDILKGKEKTVDLADAIGKINDGDVVWLEAVVKGGKSLESGKRFIYRMASQKKVRYTIGGTLWDDTLKYKGIEGSDIDPTEPEIPTISASQVNELRQMTGAGMMDCKNALVETNGDIQDAIDNLRIKGLDKAAKYADRNAFEGCVLSKTTENHKYAAILMMNCETDFVANNADFVKLTKDVLDMAVANRVKDIEALKTMKLNGQTVEALVANHSAVTGEKTKLGAFKVLEGSYVANYNHPGNRLATIVEMNKSFNGVEKVSHEVCLQVAAMAPLTVSGLLSQTSLIADPKTIAEYIQSADKDAKVVNFVRIKLGE